MNGERPRCPECGCFVKNVPAGEKAECKRCEETDDESWMEFMEEEAELDPTGPAAALVNNTEENLRSGYK